MGRPSVTASDPRLPAMYEDVDQLARTLREVAEMHILATPPQDRLDFHPPSLVPARDKLDGPHFVWWEAEEGESSVTDFAPIRYIKTVKHRFTLYVDGDGRAA